MKRNDKDNNKKLNYRLSLFLDFNVKKKKKFYMQCCEFKFKRIFLSYFFIFFFNKLDVMYVKQEIV